MAIIKIRDAKSAREIYTFGFAQALNNLDLENKKKDEEEERDGDR
jgi:hypothetical protein